LARDFDQVEAIVLAGGLGTRLRGVTGDTPKVMAQVAGRPFLAHLLDHCNGQGVTRVVLAVGFRRESVRGHFHDAYRGITLFYSEEGQPLGTGGAIRQALDHIQDKTVLVSNGDSLFRCDFTALTNKLRTDDHDIVLALKPMHDVGRYGTVIEKNGRVLKFAEKRPGATGLINGGVYALKTDLFQRIAPATLPAFSFENYLETNLAHLNVGCVISDAYFIDIGVPADYVRAQEELRLN
jgi:D-glycero-alpha-D-manno-heptose 1-phosphate guanylyltransferase